MDKKFGYYIFAGMLLGAALGVMWAAGGNLLLGLGFGALVGTAIGWFGVAAAMQLEKDKKKGK